MAVADAIREEIEQLGVTDVAPGMAAVALDLAEAIDSTDAPTSKAVVARELSALMVKLRTLAEPNAGKGALDDLTRKRDERRRKARASS